ncbi:hypothetical protein GX51_01318 [Blastomyces parvus]|uniref:Uncharacterized protein n=1 Tax=Blastomyces parvus TaxID=2060905 RepID=A0A2B7X920_9EURO|nr:hypothetical protein GX51_01318 [Blastomyces parvus]
MDKLPPETVGLIVSCLLQLENGGKVPKIASYAGISRAWQNAVELQTMRSIKVKSSSVEWKMFCGIFICIRRRSILSHLVYAHPTVPKHRQPVWPGARLPEPLQDSAADRQQEFDMDFELAVRNLFAFLREWEDEFLAANISRRAAPLTLRIEPVWKPQTLLMLKFQGQEASLPNLGRITCLIIHSVHPTAFAKIANRLSNVTKVYYFVRTSTFFFSRSSIQDFRTSLSQQLPKLSLPSLRSFHIGCAGRFPQNHFFHAPNWHRNLPVDPLSLALSLFMREHHLTDVELRFYPWALSSELFCPFSPSFPTNIPQPKTPWRNLERLMLTYGDLHPGGQWYFEGFPGSAPVSVRDAGHRSAYKDDLDYYTLPPFQHREFLSVSSFMPLLSAMSCAILHMPRLRQLSFTIFWSGFVTTERTLHIEFLMPGEPTAFQRPHDFIAAFDRKYISWTRWYSWMIISEPFIRDKDRSWTIIPQDIRELWWDKIGVERKGLIARGTKEANGHGSIAVSFAREEPC